MRKLQAAGRAGFRDFVAHTLDFSYTFIADAVAVAVAIAIAIAIAIRIVTNAKVLISGAGVAGLAVAYWLDRAGFTATLVERSPAFRRGGQAVDIRGVALEVVDAMGLHDAARALRTQLKGMSTWRWLITMHFDSEERMPRFITIGYGDQAGYDRTAPAIRNAAHAHDAALTKRGALMGIAGAPVQVRNPDASGLQTTNAAFMSSALPIAGFAVIEAADLAEAIKLVSQTPCAVAHGVVEVWPLEEP